MIKFVKMFAGVSFVPDFVDFHSRYCVNERFLSTAFWDALINMVLKASKTGPETKAPILRFAILKAAISAPESKVHRQECHFIGPSDLSQLKTKKIKEALLANSLLGKARAIVQHIHDISDDDRVRLLGRLDTSMIRVLMNKQKGFDVQYDSLEAVMCEFVEGVQALTTETVDNEWARNKQSAKPPVVPGTNPDDLLTQYTETGQLVPIDAKAVLQSNNFQQGQEVVHKKKPEIKHELHSIDGPVVKVKDVDGEVEEIDLQIFLAKWMPYAEQNYPMSAKYIAPTNNSFQIVVAKANIYVAMDNLSRNIERPDLRLQGKPCKKAYAKQDFKSYCCVLVPETGSILACLPGNQAPANTPQVQIASFGLATFFLTPPSMDLEGSRDPQPLHSAFWCVRGSSDQAEVNMVYSTKKVVVNTKLEGKRGANIELEFPVLQNRKALYEGDELVVFKPKPEKEDAKAEGSNGGKASAKRAAPVDTELANKKKKCA